MKKHLAFLLAMLVLASLPIGAVAHAEAPVTLTFLVGASEMQDWFEAQFPELVSGENDMGIKVEVEYQKEATTILQMKAAANEIPDLLNVGLPQEMIDQGKFLDLTNEAWWDALYPSAKELTTDVKSGKNYVVPMVQSGVGIFYNTEIVGELGLTPAANWDEFIANLEIVKEKKPDVTPFYLGGKETWSLSHIMDYTLMGAAKQALGYAGFENALATNALDQLGWNDQADGALALFGKYMMELKQKGLINDNAVTATYDNQVDAFVGGKAAFISQGMWVMTDIKDKNPDFQSIGFMAYPAIISGTKSVVGAPLEGTIAISAACEHVDAAKKVIELMLSADSMKSYCETLSAIPINKDVDANWSFLKDDVAAVMASDVYGATYAQNIPGAFSADENGRLVQNILVDKYATPEDFAKDYLKMWNDAYDTAHK